MKQISRMTAVLLGVILAGMTLAAGCQAVSAKKEEEAALEEQQKEEEKQNAYFKRLTEEWFETSFVQVEWQEKGEGVRAELIPCFCATLGSEQELMNFCEKMSGYLSFGSGENCFLERASYFRSLKVKLSGREYVLNTDVDLTSYDQTDFYNTLYVKLDEILHGEVTEAVNGGETTVKTEGLLEVTSEMLQDYLTREADCSFRMEDGLEYRMIAVDRACGSNYYVLLATRDQGKSCALLNPDPYNGSGGAASWISFVNEDIGFSCLTYSGGSYGCLYRTENGGVTWQEITYPSSLEKLPSGAYYNPFVMPEKVYEEDGSLYMEVGQGPEGDYYENGVYCQGLYRSEDFGISWEFVKNINN